MSVCLSVPDQFSLVNLLIGTGKVIAGNPKVENWTIALLKSLCYVL